MKINQDYNIALVHQFFATVVFGEGEDIPMTWMLGNDVFRSSFREFAGHLGYAFADANTASGLRMHIEGVAYHKKTLKPLYGKLAPSAKRKEIVLGDDYGFKTRYNILLCLFRENIAPSAGNLDAICGDLVNLLAYSHEVFVSGEEVEVDPMDVMDFIYKEMYDTVITKKKTLVYAPYVMLLLIGQHTEHPILTTHLTSHKHAKPQRKASPGVVEEVFASSDDGEEADEEEEPVEVAPRSGPRIKNACHGDDFQGRPRAELTAG
jgi:hypothetical protein